MNKLNAPQIMMMIAIAVIIGATGLMIRSSGSDWVGKDATEISGETIDGTRFSLAEERGKVVVVDFWATWCGPCIAKIPEIEAIRSGFDPSEVTVIGVSGDQSRNELVSFLDRSNLNYPTLHDPEARFFSAYEVRSIPTIMVIDREGEIVFRDHGGDINKAVTKALKR